MSVTMKTHTDYDQPHLEELQRVAGKTFAKKQTLFKRGFSLVAGLLMGLVEGLAGAYLGGEYKLLATCIVLVFILMVRPYGLFGTHEIERL